MYAILGLISTAVLLHCENCDGSRDFRLTTFAVEVTCHLQDRVTSGCAKLQEGVHRTLLECAFSCAYTLACDGISMDANIPCYHHRTCPTVFSCAGSDKLLIYWKYGQVYTNINASISSTDPITSKASSTSMSMSMSTPVQLIPTSASTTLEVTSVSAESATLMATASTTTLASNAASASQMSIADLTTSASEVANTPISWPTPTTLVSEVASSKQITSTGPTVSIPESSVLPSIDASAKPAHSENSPIQDDITASVTPLSIMISSAPVSSSAATVQSQPLTVSTTSSFGIASNLPLSMLVSTKPNSMTESISPLNTTMSMVASITPNSMTASITPMLTTSFIKPTSTEGLSSPIPGWTSIIPLPTTISHTSMTTSSSITSTSSVLMTTSESPTTTSTTPSTTTSTTPSTTTPAVRNCKNNSTYHNATNTCKCVIGWVGPDCDRYPASCKELSDYTSGNTWPGDWVQIKLDEFTYPFFTYCHIEGTFVNTYIMLNDGMKDHTKSWNEYLNGYYLDANNFWIGLAKVRALNTLGMDRLCLDTSFYYNSYNVFRYTYEGFSLGDASSKFKMNYNMDYKEQMGPYSSMLSYGNCLEDLKDAPFSTGDKDNDLSSRNCAAESGVGWWYKDCDMPCNPLGKSKNVLPSPRSSKHYNMKGLNYYDGQYAENVRIFMYFQKL